MMFGGAFFSGARRRERVGGEAERMAAAAARPSGAVTPLGGDKPPVLARDLPYERELTLQAAQAVDVRCVVLSRFAEHRAGAGDVRDPDRRDFALEALEELADARNYIVWVATRERSADVPDEAVLAQVGAVLAPVVQAFDATMRLRDLRSAA